MAHPEPSRTRRMFRSFVFGATLAVAGLMFTIAVSWWFAAADWTKLTQATSISRQERQPVVCSVQRGWGTMRWLTSLAAAPSDAPSCAIPGWVLVPPAKDDLCETDAFGWPMPALCHHGVLTRPPGTVAGFAIDSYDSIDVNRPMGRTLRLPIAPVWIGLLVDVAFWALVLGVLWLAAQTLRNGIVRWRGRCIACGYDRRGLSADAACPECGAALAGSPIPSRPDPSS